jgi:myo-inositol-1(or 4)-monophosphatase
MTDLDPARLQQWMDTAVRAAEAGADQLRRFHGQLSDSQVREKGSSGNLVTAADLAAEQAVLAVLEQETPEIGVLAEESGRRPGAGELEWCVDPLDGTTNFAHGYPVFATSVGLCWRGEPIAAALALPTMGELFRAARGHGAWCNDRRIEVSRCSTLSDALLVTGFAYDRATRIDNNYAEFAWFTHRTHGVRRGGAAAVDLAYVACGRCDGYWERGLSPWDLAAGVLLVREAGGVVSDYRGGAFRLSSDRVVACAPALHGQLVDGLGRCQPLHGAAYGAPELDAAGQENAPSAAP